MRVVNEDFGNRSVGAFSYFALSMIGRKKGTHDIGFVCQIVLGFANAGGHRDFERERHLNPRDSGMAGRRECVPIRNFAAWRLPP